MSKNEFNLEASNAVGNTGQFIGGAAVGTSGLSHSHVSPGGYSPGYNPNTQWYTVSGATNDQIDQLVQSQKELSDKLDKFADMLGELVEVMRHAAGL